MEIPLLHYPPESKALLHFCAVKLCDTAVLDVSNSHDQAGLNYSPHLPHPIENEFPLTLELTWFVLRLVCPRFAVYSGLLLRPLQKTTAGWFCINVQICE